MRTILFIIQKEFLQVFRNKSMLPIIFLVPIFQLVILVHAATYEMKDIRLTIVDGDNSATSHKLISHFIASPYFSITGIRETLNKPVKSLDQGNCGAILIIPPDFENSLVNRDPKSVQLLVDAINGTNASLINAYVTNIFLLFNLENSPVSGNFFFMPVSISTETRYWYNPELDYKTFMVPGILVLLITIIGFLLSGMNVVREKEIGTIEQINVTPIKKYQFITGKLIPFLFIALFELAFGLAIGKLLFGTPMVGSLLLVFGVAFIYLMVVLGMGLLVSTMADTQQQAMFIAFFFMMIFILMSGLFSPIENMPDWAQWIDKANPVAYFIRIMRTVLLKGSNFSDIQHDVFSIGLLAVASLGLAIWRYRKVA